MKLYMFLPFRDDSQIEKSIINVDPTFGGGVYCCDVYISRLKSSSFNETTELYFFSVYLSSINNLISIQTLISSSSFINIPMPIISVAVLILFQISILRTWKKLSSFHFFPVLLDFRCFLHSHYLCWIRKQHWGRSFLVLVFNNLLR